MKARLGSCLAAMIALLAACAEGHAGPIDPHRSLLITDAAVVSDPDRTVDPCTGSATLPVWSLGYLMKELVAQRSDITPQEFVRQWLALFGSPQTVNGQTVAPRNVEAVLLKPWADTGFDLSRIPFRLLAIANRLCRPLRFTVIVEYGVRRKSCHAVQDWARQWAALSELEFADPRYRTTLEKLTRPLIASDPAIAKPNHSWLDQMRTNEADLGTDGG